jgi:hypothetical protein
MKRFLALPFLVLLLVASPAHATVFRCTAAEAATPLRSGSLRDTDPVLQQQMSRQFGIHFDSASGLLRTFRAVDNLQSQPWQFEMIQRGTDANDLVAVSRRPCLASCPVELLRIRLWQREKTFVFVDSSGVVFVGTCTS